MKPIQHISNLYYTTLKYISEFKVKNARYIDVRFPHHTFKIKETWFWLVFENGWEEDTFKIFEHLISPHTTYVDIGAYIGPTALMAASYGCKDMYCVEASPANFYFLKKNLEKNKSEIPPYKVDNMCLYNKSGDSVGFNGGFLSTANAISHGNHRWLVNTVTIEDYFNNHNIPTGNVFTKIDIEGAESLIIEQFVELAKKLTQSHVFLSIHPPFIDDIYSFAEKCEMLYMIGDIYNSKMESLKQETLKEMILSKDQYPFWGTEHGNFFEILIEIK